MKVKASPAPTQNSEPPVRCVPTRDDAEKVQAAAALLNHLNVNEIGKKAPHCAALATRGALKIIHEMDTLCGFHVTDKQVERMTIGYMVELSQKVDECMRSDSFTEEKQKSKSAAEIIKESLKQVTFDPIYCE